VQVESAEVILQRSRLPFADGGFGRAHHAGAYQLGLALQIRKDATGSGFIASSGRNDADHAGAIAVLGDVARRFEDDALYAVLSYPQRCRPCLALAVPPAGEPLAFASEGFGAGVELASCTSF
jgi:hypothetical protein